MKKKLIMPFLLGIAIMFGSTTIANADSAPGDVVITLGQDLTQSQKDAILNQMGATSNSIIVEVSNQEEHQYLDSYLPKTTIGTKAISSARITIGNKGDGIKVETQNINWITQDTYKNAMATAGITDADVLVTAPFPVSGTAALTGILKAYEKTTGIKIPEAQKQVANEELVKTAKLGDSIGSDKATQLMSLVKEGIAEKKPQTDEDLKQIILNAAQQVGVQLSDQEVQSLVDLFNKMKNLNIDWNKVGQNITVAKDKVNTFLNQPETQNVIQKLGDFFKALIEAIKSWFK